MNPPQPPSAGAPFFERPPWQQPWVAWGLATIFAAADYLTGPTILFPVFFILPVMLLAWNRGARQAFLLAVVLCAVRLAFHFVWGAPSPFFAGLINAGLRCAVLLLLAFVTARLGRASRVLRERVQLLEGILSVCAFCKKIRDETGAWQPMEKYVSDHSRARFSHGFCPECARQHYGDFLQEDDLRPG